MFADAFRSETYRLMRNRTALFWGFLFAPLLALVGSVAQTMLVDSHSKRITEALPELALGGGGPLNLGQSLLAETAGLANPIILIFILIAAATVFAGDYRWETWRLISARNGRSNLILGKIGVVAAGTAVALLICLAANMVGEVVKGLVFGRTLGFSLTGEQMGQVLAVAGLSWLGAMQFLLIGLLAAVITRSLLAALFVPLVIGLGQAILVNISPMLGLPHDGWGAALLFPGLGFDVLKALAMGLEPEGAMTAIKAWTGLLLWIIAPAAGALAWFQRQNLSKE